MSDEPADPPAWSAMGRLDRLKHSLGNLTGMASASPGVATCINLTCVLIGVGVWHFTTGALSWIGGVYAILSALGIIKWVFRL